MVNLNYIEQQVLGGLFLSYNNREKYKAVFSILSSEDFFNDAHRFIYKTMRQLYQEQENSNEFNIDIVSVYTELSKIGKVREAGGVSYLASLTDTIPSTEMLLYVAKKLRNETMVLKFQMFVGNKIENLNIYEVKQHIEKIEEVKESLENKLLITPLGKQIQQNFMETEARYQGKTSSPYSIQTGFPPLDKIICGFEPGDLILIAGRPSLGKTSLALNMIQNIAEKQEKNVCLFSLEMSKSQIGYRFLSQSSKIPSSVLKTGSFSTNAWNYIVKAYGDLYNLKIFVDDTSSIFPSHIEKQLKLFPQPIDCIFVDYLQLMKPESQCHSRDREISEISSALKRIAKTFNIPVIALSQLSRDSDKGKPRQPRLSDLRDSGSLEQDADIVIFLHRENPDEHKNNETIPTQILIEKNRNGATGSCTLNFHKPSTNFVE